MKEYIVSPVLLTDFICKPSYNRCKSKTVKQVFGKESMLFLAIAALGFFAFIANLLPVAGNVIVGFFKYVMLPLIIIGAVMSCFE